MPIQQNVASPKPTPEWTTLGVWVVAVSLAACAHDDALSTDGDAHDERDAKTSVDAAVASVEDSSPPDAGTSPLLPGSPFEFTIGDRTYVDLSVPALVQPSSADSFAWDLLFDGLTVYTNGGGAGPGLGASFGPSSELDLLFDTAPAVPLRADVNENALLGWYWFGPNGITSRFHTYGVRDGDGRLFKLQVLDYYDVSQGDARAAVYALRFAEVTPEGSGETVELRGIDASAGGVTLPPSSPAGCVDLGSGTALALSATEWASTENWDLCFQRTEVLVNAGSSGVGAVQAIDLEFTPSESPDAGATPSEQERTAQSALAEFDAIDYARLTQSNLTWDRRYEARARMGTRWLSGEPASPSLTGGSWIIRGADGQSHFALYFTGLAAESGAARRVSVQVKPLAPPTITD